MTTIWFMTWELFPRTKKQKNADRAERSQAKGAVAEDIYDTRAMLNGNATRRRNQQEGGFDRYTTRTDILGRPVGKTYHDEIKSSDKLSLSRRQKQQEATDPNFRRVNINLDEIPGSSVLINGEILRRRYAKMKPDDLLGF